MKKVIFGILASTNEHYTKFIEIWIENIIRFKNGPYAQYIDFYFIYSEPTKIEYNNQRCFPDNTHKPNYYHYYSQYTENDSMMDSFVNRSIQLLDYIQPQQFNYFIRTNLSTLFQLDMLIHWSNSLPLGNIIAGPPIDKLNSIYTFISGTCICLSRDLVDFLLLNKQHILDKKVLYGDDVRISSLIIENLNVEILLVKRLDFVEISYDNGYIPPSVIFQNSYDINNLFCYRFKTNDRESDVKYMKLLLKSMYSKDYKLLQFVGDLVDDTNTPYENIVTQNTDYDKLTTTIFQIKTTSDIMKQYHRYKNVCFRYPESVLKI